MAVINAVGKFSQTPYRVEISGDAPTPEEQGRIDAYVGQQEAPYAQIYQEYFGSSEPSETVDIPEGLDENTYRTALRQGYQMIKSRGGTAIEYAGKGLGSDIIEEFGEGVTDKAEGRLNELGSMVDRTTFSEVEGVGSAGRFAGELAAEQAPQLGLSAAGTYIGGGIGGALGLVGGPAGVIAGSSLGAYLGTALTSGPLLFGGDIQRQEGQVAKGELERVDAAKALLATFGQVGLETVANAILVLKPIKALGKGGLFARTAKTGAAGVAAEGLTEIGQQMIERKQAGLEWDPTKSDEALQEYIEAGVAGGILGGGLGGAGAAFRGDLSQHQKDKELEADIEALEAENTIKRDRGLAAAQRSPAVTREGEATTEGLYGDPVADPAADPVVTPEEQAALDAQAEVDTLAETAKVSKAQELQLKIKDPTKLPQAVRTEALRAGIAQKGDSRPDIIKKIQDMAVGGGKVARAPSKAMRGKQDRKLGTRTQKKGGYDQRAFDAAVDSVKSLGKFSPKAIKEALEKVGTKPNQKVTTGSRPSNRSTTTALAEVKSEMVRRGIISDDNKATYQNPEAVDTADNAAQVEADLYLKEMERDKLRAESDALFKAVQETEARERAERAATSERASTDGQANVDPSQFGSFAPKQANVFSRLREMLTKMGMSDVKLEAETGFIDGMAEGSFAGTTKTIALAVGVYDPNMNEDQLFEAVAEVMNHETIHALRSLGVITAKELKVLAKAAANTKYAHKDGTKREYTYLDRAKRLYGNLSQTKEQDGTPSQVDEEAIAEMFRDYAAGRLKIGGSPRNIFGKIKRFLMKLMRKANKAGYSRPQDIFDAIISGEVGSRKTERQLGGESGPTTATSTGDPNYSKALGFQMNPRGGVNQDGRSTDGTVQADGSGRQQGDNRGRGGSRSIEGGGLTPLEGAPTIRGHKGPIQNLVKVADKYAEDFGINYLPQVEYAKVDPIRAARIAQAYTDMPNNPNDPEVKEAYADLIEQTKNQYDALVNDGYDFFFINVETGYADSPATAMEDLRLNKKMGIFPTDDGYGSDGSFDVAENPMLEDTGLMWPDQKGNEKPVYANDLFRAVHDAFGHGLEGAGFRARGEENAWQAHMRLFTGPALGAITSETRGQNSWMNYGPHGEFNRTASAEDSIFADQKTGLMPSWTWKEGIVRSDEQSRDAVRKELLGDKVQLNQKMSRAIPLTKEQYDASILDYLDPKTGKPVFKSPAGDNTLVEFAKKIAKLRLTPQYDVMNSEADREALAQIAAAEAEAALISGSDALGWYDATLKLAKQILYPVYPEISPIKPDGSANPAYDEAAEHAFDYATAVTSNGLAVIDNYSLAAKAYDVWSKTGRWDDGMASGKQGKSMQKAWMFWNALSDQGMNSQQIKQLLNTQIPRGQINNILKQVFDVKSIDELPVTPDASEEAGTTVSIAYVIGPKIGNGFYQNLNGNYDPLTMDRWWMRFFNRISGDMIEVFDEAKLDKSRDDLFDILQGRSEILSEMDKAIIKTVRRELGVKKLLKKDLDLIAPKIQATFDREYFNKTYNNTMEELDNASPETRYNFEIKGTKVTGPDADIVKKIAQGSRPKNTKLIRTANTLAKKLKPALQEAPRTAQDRTAMKDVANRARKILKDQLGVDITNADFQALMWYAEKRIFEAGGVRKGRGEDNDYADGALALLKERGIADATIKNTLPAAERGRFDSIKDDKGTDSTTGKPVEKLTAAQRKQIKELESESPKFFEPREVALSDRRISDDLTSEEMVAVDKALSEMPLDPNVVQKKLSAAPTNPYRMVRTPTKGEADYVYGNIYEDGKKKPVFLLEGADEEGVGFGLYHIQQKRPEDTRSHEQEFQEFYGYDNASEAIYEVMKLWSKQGNRDGKNVTSSNDPRNGRLSLVWNKAPKYPVKIVISKFNPVTKKEASDKDVRLGNYLYSILTSYPETPKQSRKSSAAFSTSYATTSGTSNATAMNNQMMRYTTISDFLAKQINRFTSDKSVGQKAADKFFQKIQDSFLPVGRVIDDLKRLGATITDAMDPYLQQQLSVGVTGDKIATRKDTIYRDVAKAVNKMRISDRQIDNLVQVSNDAARQYASNNGMQGASEGLAAYNMKDPQSKSLSLLDTYLYAKHAKERNAYVRSIDSTNDMGSGMSDLEADAIIGWFDTQLVPRDRNAIAEGERAIRAIVKDTNDERFGYGLQPDQATLGSNGPNYQFYVPLKGHMEMDEETGTSGVPSTPKYGAKGREDQRVMGRRSYGRDISFNAMLQNTDTITRGERNKVGQSWLELVRNEPSKMQSYGEILQQKPSRRVMKNGQVVMAVDPNYKTRDDILVVKEGGNEVVYQFYPDQLNLAGAFTGKNVWTAQNANVILRGTQKLNRWLSNINTSWNPEFLISNLARDIQAAGISLGEFDAKGLQSTVMTTIPKATLGMKRSIRNGDDSSEWAKKYKEFRAAGGASAANPMNSLADQIGNLGDVLNDMSDAGGKSRAAWNKSGKRLVKAMEDYNLIFENSVRVTTFHALKDAGVSPERAAQAARSVTVDFGKSGDWGGFVNSLYLFYNASLQGSFFFLRSLSRMPKAKLAKYVGGIMAVGALMDTINAFFSDEDEDGIKEVDKIPDYVAEHNWVIMTPFLEDTPYFSLPMPYGMNMLYNTGRAAAQYVRGGKRIDQASKSIGSTLLEVVNPLGGSEHFLNFALPTVVDPFVSLYGTNKDFSGRDIVKTAFPNQIASDASLYWSSTSPTAVSIANSLNELTGGSDAVSGWIDWSPDSLEFWYDYITGATGKTIQRGLEVGPKLASADNAEDFWNTVGRDFPMARKLIGNIGDGENLSVYIDKRDRINVARQELKNAYEAGDRERFEAAKERYPDELRAMAGMKKAESARRKNSQRVNMVKNAQNITEERREELLSQLREQKKKIISFGIRAAANI